MDTMYVIPATCRARDPMMAKEKYDVDVQSSFAAAVRDFRDRPALGAKNSQHNDSRNSWEAGERGQKHLDQR